jgi:hypothetical protein
MDAFAGEDAQVIPPGDCEEFVAAGTAKKVENKPGSHPDEAEKHEEWEDAGKFERVMKIEPENERTEWQ